MIPSRFFASCFFPLLGITCLKGKKPCKDDNKKCAVYCDGNPECTDASDELDCGKYNDKLSLSEKQLSMSINHSSSVTLASATIVTTAVAQSTRSFGKEIDRANAPEATTDGAEATLPQVSVLDRETIPPGVMTTYKRIYRIARFVLFTKIYLYMLALLDENFCFCL